MESSRFIQLSNDILVEYIYSSQSNHTTFNTTDYPIEILKNNYTGDSYFFNTDSVSSIMGNYRDISATPVNETRSKYVYLDTSVGVPYNDFDPNLTPSNDLLQTFSPQLEVVYDNVKIHFTAGFTFQDFDGIIFEISIPKRNVGRAVIASINFLKTDTPVFNPNPILLSEKLYSTYIEFRVPSSFYMNNNFSSSDLNGVSYRLTEGTGFKFTPPITISALGILSTAVNNGYNFYSIKEINSTSILNRDIYDNLYASVVESSVGDYFELRGLVNGSSLSNLIADLNSSGGNYMVFHEIILTEQIGSNFIQTASQIINQTSEFDDPILFRPIILNSSVAVSFSINYNLRLYNRSDNTQIIKQGRLLSFDVKKYGRRLMKINLGTVPTVATVVNQIRPDDSRNITISNGNANNRIQFGENSTNIVTQTRFVTSFRDRINIKAAISPVQIQNIEE